MIATDILLFMFALGFVAGMVFALMIGRLIFGWTRGAQL
jgi:hypothetical protein